VSFVPKYHMINADWRLSLPARHARRLDARASVSWLWWDDHFAFEEVVVHGVEAQEAALLEFVRRVHPYPAWRLALDRGWRGAAGLARRAGRRLARAGAREAAR
jgi:hypothetical protein